MHIYFDTFGFFGGPDFKERENTEDGKAIKLETIMALEKCFENG